jgi:hypothetical protein
VNATPSCYLSTDPHQPQQVNCFAFHSWSELYDILNRTNLTFGYFFAFYPATSSLILNSQSWKEISKVITKEGAFPSINLQFYRLKGISILDWPQNETTTTLNVPLSIDLFQSEIEFYIANKRQSEFECTRDIIQRVGDNIFQSTFFRSAHSYLPTIKCLIL